MNTVWLDVQNIYLRGIQNQERKKKRDLPTRKRPVTFFTVQKSNASNITISTKFNTNDLEIV